jgi:hypothetical protein
MVKGLGSVFELGIRIRIRVAVAVTTVTLTYDSRVATILTPTVTLQSKIWPCYLCECTMVL